ncbi:hypothetical protein AB9K34_19295 [Sedimentitalea sp. XS_ASV28]|uniref:hypothetical protein n=1 Tax=Sedimentitalea sp. XS_ASV28 TaxID=3241296 RepID=UPI003518C016
MTHTVDSISSSNARPVSRNSDRSRLWIALALAAAVIGFLTIEGTGARAFLAGLNLETGSIPGEDWHGNVRRSTPSN